MRDVVLIKGRDRWRVYEGEMERLDNRQKCFPSPFKYLQAAIDGIRLQLQHHQLLTFVVPLRQWYAIGVCLGLLVVGEEIYAYGS